MRNITAKIYTNKGIFATIFGEIIYLNNTRIFTYSTESRVRKALKDLLLKQIKYIIFGSYDKQKASPDDFDLDQFIKYKIGINDVRTLVCLKVFFEKCISFDELCIKIADISRDFSINYSVIEDILKEYMEKYLDSLLEVGIIKIYNK